MRPRHAESPQTPSRQWRLFFFSSRRRHTRCRRDWSSDVCSSDLSGEIKFSGQVLPTAKMVRYRLDIRRVINRKLVLGIADGLMEVDGRPIYEAKNLRVGLFQDRKRVV